MLSLRPALPVAFATFATALIIFYSPQMVAEQQSTITTKT